MISDKYNVRLGIVDCSLYYHRIALRDDYHKKQLNMLAYTPLEFNSVETLAKISINPARQNLFIQENVFSITPVRRIAVARKWNSAFAGSYSENLI